MDIQELLTWTDERVLANTGKHLDSLQKAILEGIWQHQDYKEIADSHYRSYEHVKKEAWKLWKLLSDACGEDVKKSNVRSVLESKVISNISYSTDIDVLPIAKRMQIVGTINGNINICDKNTPASVPSDSPENAKRSPIIDLTDAPELIDFYNRTTELSTLKEWILQAQTRLIAIYGLSGIGKSAMTLKLIEQIQTEFDYIIWRSLNKPPTLATLQADLKQIFSRTQPTPSPTLMDCFRSCRCLLILDDLHNLFSSGQLVGQYLAEYEDYGKFFKKIATSVHRSCVILLSWENPREIATLEASKRPVRTFHLKGLGENSKEILHDRGLTDEHSWSELIRLYQGHPAWLTIIAATIVELFNGRVSLFMAENDEIFLGDLEPLISLQLERLSDSEIQVCYGLAREGEAVDISQYPSELSKSKFWQAIQSLARRGLVEKYQVEGRYMFLLNPIFEQYIQFQLP